MKFYNRWFWIVSIWILLIGCGSSSNLNKPDYKKEIPINVLGERGIIPINSHYKGMYPYLLSYVFYNDNNSFNKIQGDFYNLKHSKSGQVNIMPGYWKEYGDIKKSFIVVIAMTDSSTASLKNLPTSVKSSKYGFLVQREFNKPNEFDIRQQRQLFIKNLDVENDWDILEKVEDDVITVTIGEQSYTFINPEFAIEQESSKN
ncbi:hypothetical protein SAMN03097699_0223 [Flavobacteriaceae bacterium MAR_2010_188]|nr:hypothetical protein SAMN03097699_0223 [Flavobacteriaceae bacterium MAR_2010_188]